MKTSNSSLLLSFATAVLALFLVSCSELSKDIPPVAPKAKAHPSGWLNPSDPVNFHGVALQNADYDLSSCVTCHGASLAGGISNESCSQCHGTTYPHPETWSDNTNASYHGAYLKGKGYKSVECQECHGTDYRGAGDPSKSCYRCHNSYPHLPAWTNVAAGSSHGHYLKGRSWATVECRGCHGEDHAGGSSGQSCFTCHPSYPHVAGIGTSHPASLRTAGYPFGTCHVCHGTDYAGGTVGVTSCMISGCHRDASNNPKSPEACNTCHGNFRGAASEPGTWAPSTGAHAKHLSTNVRGATAQCRECHNVPSTTFAAGHLGTDGVAEIAFNGPVALTQTDAGRVVPTPAYNSSTGRCSNTYCHGNWVLRRSSAQSSYQHFYTDSLMVGANAQPSWTGGAGDAACGTCHAIAPAGHFSFALNACATCHADVIDAAGNFIDKSKHVNGKRNVFDSEVAAQKKMRLGLLRTTGF